MAPSFPKLLLPQLHQPLLPLLLHLPLCPQPSLQPQSLYKHPLQPPK